MNIISNGQIKRRTALANRKAMPVAPVSIARNAMHRHTKILIAAVYASKRYSLSFRGLGISFSDLFLNVIPVLIRDIRLYNSSLEDSFYLLAYLD